MKTPEKPRDLEKWKGVFFQTGMIIALTLSLVAFEWRTERPSLNMSGLDPFATILEDLAPITIHKPPVAPPPKPQPVVVFNAVDDKKVVDIEVIIDAGDHPNKPIQPYEPIIFPEPEPAGEIEIFRVVEKMPSFPGGVSAMLSFLGRNIRYPELARQIGISGTVHIGFVVDTDGRVTHAEVLRGIGGGCDEEALRVVSLMPAWEPGKQRGKAVRVAMSIPVKFVLL